MSRPQLSRKQYRNIGIVLCIFALAVISFLAYTSTQAQRKAVLTVRVRVEAGSVVTDAMLTTMEVPTPGRDDPFPYFTSSAGVVGRSALVTLLPNVPIAEAAIGDAAPPGRLLPSGQVIPPGHVGYAIPTTALRSVGGALKIGDTVSILIPEERKEDDPILTPEQTITYTVLYAGIVVVDLRDEAGVSLIGGEATGTAAYIVLALGPEQPEAIARYEDTLKLALEAR